METKARDGSDAPETTTEYRITYFAAGTRGPQHRAVRNLADAEGLLTVLAEHAPLIERRTVTKSPWGIHQNPSAVGSITQIHECTCVYSCADDPVTACDLSGDFHVHPDNGSGTFGPCPVHPDAPGDH